MQFRKKLEVVEAFQLTEENRIDNRDWPEWLNRAWNRDREAVGSVSPATPGTGDGPLVLQAGSCLTQIHFGDWIIKGGLFPYLDEEFKRQYEPVEQKDE